MAAENILALDAMGGDNAPESIVSGASIAAKIYQDLNFIFFGDKSVIESLVLKASYLNGRCEIVHAASKINSDEKPGQAVRRSKGTSMRLAIEAVNDGQAFGVVSAGNTGALMALSKMVLKTLPGIDRPAIASTMPCFGGKTVVLDLGANVNCDADDLMQFAIMGNAYAKALLYKDNPKIGILNIGSEEVKGHDEVRLAAQIIKESDLANNFYGFVEGDDIAKGTVDVVVTDGFSGNIALKTAEGTGMLMSRFVKESFSNHFLSWLFYFLAKPAILKLKSKLDPRNYNGAMFVGLNGIALKSHGSSDAKGFANAIAVAVDLHENNVNDKISQEINSMNF